MTCVLDILKHPMVIEVTLKVIGVFSNKWLMLNVDGNTQATS